MKTRLENSQVGTAADDAGAPHNVTFRRGTATRPGSSGLAVGAVGVTVAAAPLLLEDYWIGLVNLALLAAIGAVGLNLLTGTSRLVSLGQAAFLAAGAFTAVLLTTGRELPFPLVVLAAAIVGAILGGAVGLPSLRLKALYVVVTTVAVHFAVTLATSIYQSRSLMADAVVLPTATVGPVRLASPTAWYVFLLAGTLVVVSLALNLTKSHVGRRWIAVADDELAAQALGIRIERVRLTAFVVTSALVSAVGAVGAYYHSVVSSESYSLVLAITYLAMIVVGGLGSVLGAVAGAFIITLLPYLLDEAVGLLGMHTAGATMRGLHRVAYGGLIIAFLLKEPLGIAELARRWWDHRRPGPSSEVGTSHE